MSDTLTLGTPTLADDLKLTPQARKILAHLKQGKTITPLKAQGIYGISRLSDAIFKIRNGGYVVVCEQAEDEAGHRYGRYYLWQ